jgi:excisionase family DNA binding protein
MTALLSVSEVADRLKADVTTVRLWCRQGRFPNARQIGRSWIIPDGDIESFQRPEMGRPPKATKEKAGKGYKKKGGKK